MKAALRAFCKATSVPKTGASGVRTKPSTTPWLSTTEIVTCAAAPVGLRICARARLATSNAERKVCSTSAAVKPPSLPARKG